ncbi:MAG: CHASE domain-containing protein, partial [Rhodocyclaceae bacterium]|nr:CHASE domain-containing protein [Rhodocyclaceae bacterium]
MPRALAAGLPPWMLALLVALVGFAATAWLSLREDEEERTRAQEHFAALAGEYAHGFLQRLRDSTAPMAAVAALHQAHRGLRGRDFDEFLAALLAERRMPGLVSMAWIPRVRENDREDFVARMRGEADPAYRIHPDPGPGDVQPVAFITATGAARERALGFDTLSHPERRAVIERAVGEGRVAMTGPLVAATDDDGPQRRSVIMYLPVFATDVTLAEPDVRRAALRGVVGAAFHMEELTAQLPAGMAGAFLHVADMETSAPAWFASHPAEPAAPLLTADEILSFGGRLLKLEFRSTSPLETSMLPGSGRQVALFGSSLSLVLSLFVFYLASARRRAEQAVVRATASLRASEERFALAAQVSADAIWERDLVGGGMRTSARVDELLGLPPGATGPGGVDPQNLIHPEDRPRQRAAMEAHLRDGSPYAVEFRVRHADGRWLWLRSRGIAQMDAGGRPLRMVGTVTDVTAERTEEDRLARYRVFLRSILDTIPDPVAVKGRDRRYVMV